MCSESQLKPWNFQSCELIILYSFAKASWSWVTLDYNQKSPNISSLHKWGNRGPERKRVTQVSVWAGKNSRDAASLLENLSSRCLPQSRPLEFSGALLLALFHIPVLLNHAAFSPAHVSFDMPPNHPHLRTSEKAPCQPEPSQLFSRIRVLFWTSRKPATLSDRMAPLFVYSPYWQFKALKVDFKVSVSTSRPMPFNILAPSSASSTTNNNHCQ